MAASSHLVWARIIVLDYFATILQIIRQMHYFVQVQVHSKFIFESPEFYLGSILCRSRFTRSLFLKVLMDCWRTISV